MFALGPKETIVHLDQPLSAVPAVGLCGGLSLYFLTRVVQRVRIVYMIRRSHPLRSRRRSAAR